MPRTYEVYRFFAKMGMPAEIIMRGLTLEAAQEHCRDPETSSSTAMGTKARALTAARGEWFDGYREERE